MKRNRNDERWCCLILGCVPTLNQESWTHYCEGLRALKILHQEERHPVGGRGSDLNLVCFLKLKYPQTSAFLGSECCSSTADPGWNVPRGLILTFPLMQRWMDGWVGGWPWHFVQTFMFLSGWIAVTSCQVRLIRSKLLSAILCVWYYVLSNASMLAC